MLYVCFSPAKYSSARGSCDDLFLSSVLRFSFDDRWMSCTQLWWAAAKFPVTCGLNLMMYESAISFALVEEMMGAGSLPMLLSSVLSSSTGEADAAAASANPMTLFMMAVRDTNEVDKQTGD